jgi:hypothetical protein
MEMFIVHPTHDDPTQPLEDRMMNMDRLEFAAYGKLRVKGRRVHRSRCLRVWRVPDRFPVIDNLVPPGRSAEESNYS